MYKNHFAVATVSFQESTYQISEGMESIQISLTRSGNLKNTSVVLVATDNFQGSASGNLYYNSHHHYYHHYCNHHYHK